ncbi:hypothetical protein CKM354_000973700 [Cercospora kikuchii]|uniref:F-box domain-containing protein n=1 Tax=Cercospora kikuchii TaxID=84275 RepID=A0A9P3CNW6_9PEZI|nr:uncharacterized protein CKM354_000973700 [Cercospora kikuchii]GIZ46617.1 hypothetical protein CKM354_000973700 [Cercospora kikuchii]
MADTTSDVDSGDGEEWVILPPKGAIQVPEGRQFTGPSRSTYVKFQLQFSFRAASCRAHLKKKKADIEETKLDQSINPQNQSLLFLLPTELRLNIYEHLLSIPTSRGAVKIAPRPSHGKDPVTLAILLTCRRALAEAEEIFYSVNRFSIDPPTSFLDTLGARRLSAITKLELVVGQPSSMLIGLKQLHCLPNLGSLHVRRTVGLRYQNVSAWAVMAPQLIAEIWKMESLSDIRFGSPGTNSLEESDSAHMKRLSEIDQKLCSVAPKRS